MMKLLLVMAAIASVAANTVEMNHYALLYDNIYGTLVDETVYKEGWHFLTASQEFIEFPGYLQNIDFYFDRAIDKSG